MSEQSLKYGIVVPVYKTAHCLKRSLESLLDQKYTNKRILCILDGKDDEALKIIKELKKIEYKVLDKQTGAPHARNTGADEFGNEVDLLLFWDSDSYMEPGALQDWVNVFEKHPDIDFVYSDYRFTIQEMGMITGEVFDPWLLKCNNYISTMSPIRAEIKPRFDETIESLQDWDLWLTLVEKGYKGKYLPGIRFTTSLPSKDSISGKGCQPEEWLNRKNKIKIKHNIPNNPICFTSLSCPERTIDIAKQIGNADFMRDPSFNKHDYKLIYLLGFYAQDAINHAKVFRNGRQGMKKVIHWLGSDVDALFQLVPLNVAFGLGDILGREYINFCETSRMKSNLKKIGIDAEILKLPVNLTDLPEDKPKEFKILYDGDKAYKPFLNVLINSMPDIQFVEFTQADISDYYVFIRFTSSGILDEACKKFLCSGRRIITNIAEPYAGYMEDSHPEVVLRNTITTIRSIKKTFDNNDIDAMALKGKEYYRKILSWENYRNTINRILEKGLLWNSQIEQKDKKSHWSLSSFLAIIKNLL